MSHLERLLVIFDVVTINIVVRTKRLPQLRTDNQTRSLGGGATREQHDASTCILEGGFKQTNSNAESNTGTSQRSLVVGNRPRVTLQLLQDLGDLEISLRDGEKEARGGALRSRGATMLLLDVGAKARSKQSEHLLHLFRRVILAAAEGI